MKIPIRSEIFPDFFECYPELLGIIINIVFVNGRVMSEKQFFCDVAFTVVFVFIFDNEVADFFFFFS